MPEITIQRIEGDAQVHGHRAEQGCIPRIPFATRHTGKGDGQIAGLVACGGLAEDVQAVADLAFFQLTQIGIKFCQIVIRITVKARIFGKAGDIGQRQNFGAQMFDPARIDARRLIVFVHQCFEIAQRSVVFGAGQRRGKVVDDDCTCAPFGLGAFAWIVDDERVDMWRGTKHGLWPACVFGLAPAGCNIVFDIPRQGIEILFVERERQGGATVCVGAIGQPVCGASHHLIHECLGIGGR